MKEEVYQARLVENPYEASQVSDRPPSTFWKDFGAAWAVALLVFAIGVAISCIPLFVSLLRQPV